MRYIPSMVLNSATAFDLQQASDLHDLPTFYAVRDFLPMHRLSLVLAPSGTGLTQLACQIATSMTPPHPEEAEQEELDPRLKAEQEAVEEFYRQEEEERQRNPAPPPPDNPDDEHNLHFLNPIPSASTPAGDASPSAANQRSRIKNTSVSLFTTTDRPTVLMISQRDSADVLRPRLLSMGANLRDILVLSQVTERVANSPDECPDEEIRPFAPKDHVMLSELLHEHKSIRLVIIDNADWMFNRTNNPTRAQLQRQLACLENVADTREVAILLLTSIPALTANPFPNRLVQTLRDACRTVHLLAPDLQDPNYRLLFTLKNSVGDKSPTRRLHLFPKTPPTHEDLQRQFAPAPPDPDELPPSAAADNGQMTTDSPDNRRLTAESPTKNEDSKIKNLTYPHYLARLRNPTNAGRPPHLHDFACEVIREALQHGPLPAGSMDHPKPGTMALWAREANLSWKVLCHAKKTLQVTSTKTAAGWTWQLPDTIPSLPKPEISNLKSQINASTQSEISNLESETAASTETRIPDSTSPTSPAAACTDAAKSSPQAAAESSGQLGVSCPAIDAQTLVNTDLPTPPTPRTETGVSCPASLAATPTADASPEANATLSPSLAGKPRGGQEVQNAPQA